MMSLDAISISFAVVVLAEMGDKSQLVCMAVAARQPARLVLIGAIAAFAVLNAVAVIVGGSLAHWLPAEWVLAGAAAMFGYFGWQACKEAMHHLQGDEELTCQPISRKQVVWSTFSLIAIAELGDKTQLSVAALSANYPVVPVWLGATVGLAFTTGIGVVVGCTLLRRLNMQWLHGACGGLFLLMAIVMAYRAFS
ncbi:TMEM165/GDT1 family protein [Neiella marina]|uniref:GDT1 family protein n=1 Tax=Neiella holothuriorum TaxID=2870530 RepID=A0ABS7ECE4_9GAMM|nr:TMEM165/GDT1 family protein [Neiella holothuriorum]MBW8190002.1 TMEM165/GDT1 family protein [Neiella holothuriorum]